MAPYIPPQIPACTLMIGNIIDISMAAWKLNEPHPKYGKVSAVYHDRVTVVTGREIKGRKETLTLEEAMVKGVELHIEFEKDEFYELIFNSTKQLESLRSNDDGYYAVLKGGFMLYHRVKYMHELQNSIVINTNEILDLPIKKLNGYE